MPFDTQRPTAEVCSLIRELGDGEAGTLNRFLQIGIRQAIDSCPVLSCPVLYEYLILRLMGVSLFLHKHFLKEQVLSFVSFVSF